MGRVLISVITPIGRAHNLNYLKDSSLFRAHNPTLDFEWIIVCDGFAKGELADADLDADVYELPTRQGSGIARNFGLAKAQGEWIYALDYDDYPMPGGIEKLHAAAGDRYLWAAGRGMRVSHDLMTELESHHPLHITPWKDTIPLDAVNTVKETYDVYPHFFAGATLLQTQMVRELGGWNVELSARGQDVPLFIEISKRYPGGWVPDYVFKYRRHPLSNTFGTRDVAVEHRIDEMIQNRSSEQVVLEA